MIQQESVLLKWRIIRAPGRVKPASACWGVSRRRYASIGDVIVVAVKDAMPNARVSRRARCGVLSWCGPRRPMGRRDGSYIKFR